MAGDNVLSIDVPGLGDERVELREYQAKEALRILCHTVLFTRALGRVRPREVESAVFRDLTCAAAATAATAAAAAASAAAGRRGPAEWSSRTAPTPDFFRLLPRAGTPHAG